MSLFDDSIDDSLLEIPVFQRIKSKLNSEELEANNRIDDSFESLPAISRPPVTTTDKSNDTLTLDSDSEEEKQSTKANDVSNDSIEVVFCSPTLQSQQKDNDLNEDIEDKPNDGNTSVMSFRSIGSNDWTPIKPKFINRTPFGQKTVRNRTQSSLKKSINFLNKKQTKEQKEMQRVIQREDKERERNEKKIQKELQKQKENANKQVLKSRGIKNANKYCFAVIDRKLYELIKNFLDKLFAEKESNFRINDCPSVPMSVTWIRKSLHLIEEQMESSTCGQSSQMSSQTTIGDREVPENHILVVIEANDFIERVNSYVTNCGETLFDLAKEVIEKTNLKNLTLLVLKLEQYFKRQKTKAQSQFKQRINQLDSDLSNPNRRQNRRESMPSVTREDVDLALIDMEFKLMAFDSQAKISVIKANDYSEVTTYIYRYTRSVAESLIRNERKNQNIGWFAEADNRSTVDPTDASSHEKLWKRQLMQFPKISYEIANAIVSQYPTPKSLLEGYSRHSNPESLLEDIVVSRRQPNATNTHRKVGKQLSNRIHLFMTSRNGDQLLSN